MVVHFTTTRSNAMSISRSPISKAVAAAVLGISLIAAAAPATTQPFAEGGHGPGPHHAKMSEADRAQMRERMQARMVKRLDRLGARLEIKASQQDAWGAFRNSVESVIQDRPQRPARNIDAAALLRVRADMAQRRAQHLTTLAEATANLQQALEPDQRKVLDEVVRNLGPRGRHGRRHGGHRYGRHDTQQGDRHGKPSS
jgi:hypothetical protein